jgi:hypothetical protein
MDATPLECKFQRVATGDCFRHCNVLTASIVRRPTPLCSQERLVSCMDLYGERDLNHGRYIVGD